MKRKDGLQKLEYLIKELNDTHSRLQMANPELQAIEAALLNQQILHLYGHIQQVIPSLSEPVKSDQLKPIVKEAKVQAPEAPVKPSVSPDAERKKALLKNNIKPAENNTAEIKVTEEFIEIPSKTIIEKVEEVQIKNEVAPIEEVPNTIHPVKETFASASEQSLHEKLGIKNEPSLNEKFSSLQNKQSLSDKLKLSPIKDLKAAIGLNQKVTFINVLFKGSDKEFKNAIGTINNFNNLSEAKIYIQSNLANKFQWDDNNEMVVEFMQLVQRRFI